ncbi:hypothetical protein ACTXJ2_08020 [Psychrobacter alimentarius]|nr:hypothetical protein [Psychrobacter sp. JB193]
MTSVRHETILLDRMFLSLDMVDLTVLVNIATDAITVSLAPLQ